MPEVIDDQVIADFKSKLESHPVYATVTSLNELRVFMQHHVYSVWDFMSLIKYLQSLIAPTSYPWVPRGDGNIRRFINELVLEEESDEAGEGQFSSHFELYHQAMLEIGADIQPSLNFIDLVNEHGIEHALSNGNIPEPSRQFMQQTFSFIKNGKPHQVAAALALGREHIIPMMFRSLLDKIGVDEQMAPVFHYYLKRHIHLDEDFHAPLSLRLLNGLCGNDTQRFSEAKEAANLSVQARITFWDGVQQSIRQDVV